MWVSRLHLILEMRFLGGYFASLVRTVTAINRSTAYFLTFMNFRLFPLHVFYLFF